MSIIILEFYVLASTIKSLQWNKMQYRCTFSYGPSYAVNHRDRVCVLLHSLALWLACSRSGHSILWASARTAHIATRVCTKTAASSARWCEQAAPQPPQYRVVHPASGVKIFVQSHARQWPICSRSNWVARNCAVFLSANCHLGH
jgi:hypothetical protein